MPQSDQQREAGTAVQVAGGILCLLCYGYLSWTSQGYGQATLTDLFVTLMPCAVITFALWALEYRAKIAFSWRAVIVFAVLFRLVGVFAYPVLEDDHFRYLWDGWMFVEFGTPYGIAPAQFFSDDAVVPDALTEALDGINYPEIPTVYGPVAQWIFGASYLAAPAKAWPLQIVGALADIAVVLMLARIASLRWVFLYAWSPLLVKEFSFTAHIDVVGAAAIMAAVLASRQTSTHGSLAMRVAVGVALGLSAGIKPFALIAAPFLLRRDWVGWASLAATCVCVALPFGLVDAWLPVGLRAMAAAWLFNAPIYLFWLGTWPTDWAVATLPTLKTVLSLAFIATWAVYGVRHVFGGQPNAQDNGGALYWLFGLLFLVIPVFNPWYMVWVLTFAVLRPTATAWVASVMVLLSYVTGLNLADSDMQLYEQPLWAILTEFSCIAAAFVYDLVRVRAPRRRRPPWRTAR